MKAKTIPVFLAFLCMGFGDIAGVLTSQLQKTYDLSNFIAGLVTFMGFIMFGVLSIPMAVIQDRKSRKSVLLFGLLAAFGGLVLPVIGNFNSYLLMLGSLLLLGTGATMMQVSGNPVMRDVSGEGRYSRNLSFGQFIKGIGTLSGPVIILAAVNFRDKDWRLVFPVYALIVLVTCAIVFFTPIYEKKEKNSRPASFASCFKLLFRNRFIATAVLGIFLYVGAEVTMIARLPNYLAGRFGVDITVLGLSGSLYFLIALMTGRLFGGISLNWLEPKKFLAGIALFSLVGMLVLYLAPDQLTGTVGIFVIGLGFANVFPLIFSISVDTFPERGNEISGLMVTAITGGAFIPLLYGAVADMFSLMAGFLVPVVCMLYVLFLSVKMVRGKA